MPQPDIIGKPCPHRIGFNRGCKLCGMTQDQVARNLAERANPKREEKPVPEVKVPEFCEAFNSYL